MIMTGIEALRFSSRRSSGVTLVELLIAMAIGTVLSLAMSAVFVKVIESRTEIDRTGQKLENGRYAMEVLGEEIRLAGFYGGYRPPSVTGGTASWQTPSPCETAIASLGWGWNGPAAPPSVPVPIMAFEGHGTTLTATGVLSCLSNYRTGTDVLVVRRLSTTELAPGSGAVSSNAPYLQVSACNGDTQDFVFGAGSATGSFVLKRGDAAMGSPICLQSNPATGIRQFFVKIFYVATCDVCSPSSDSVPTLKEVTLDAAGGALAMTTRSMVPGIEDLHVDFGVDDDTSKDGSIDLEASGGNYRDSNATAAPSFNWQDVMAVRASVIARDLQPTNGYVDAKTYRLGNVDVSPPSNSPFKRRVFSSVFRLPNLVGRREREI